MTVFPRLILLSCGLLAGLWLASAAAAAGDARPGLRVMSFNVRVPVEADGPNRWEARRELMVQVIGDAAPDVVGTQELVAAQGRYLVAHLPGYAWFGSGRRGDGKPDDERMGVFYRTYTLGLIESGNFWLSETPEVPGSISWGNPYPRMVTWGLFERWADGRRFYLFNTHFPYRQEDGEARRRCAELLAQRIAELAGDAPVVLTGDFNDEPGSPAYARLQQDLDDAFVSAALREGPAATFHGFSGRAERRIDWAWSRGLKAERLRTVDDHAGERYPSDHFPMLVDYSDAEPR
ncbi:endonuclease [Pseudoxanthomonas kalamensis DSM 18571]|uniref:endonuclease/exonuclease/phosphatase family protein n=1 Tax=Pseudoxanthomonas kalamensis TaxID=289483 RepID=UPI001390F391|nr:endonuclease/exonuclease/phosphatase family protein [Pseudoxanthomonas kalamensis]KAF1711227.1 endonuclease [Pseudoxanthomonas kalamensis DSM 18571]